ncbi:MAG: acetoacetate-CoA ligase [Solirubrobacterales bacterium]|nr:acetoacetate-CoA ligase [Solirubrobacterales bacterium]
MAMLMRERGFDSYAELWRWSVDDLPGFWGEIWRRFGVGGEPGEVLAGGPMPDHHWFPGVELNYAGHLLAGRPDGEVAIRHASEVRPLTAVTWRELREAVRRCAAGLRRLGVGRGDRVAAYLPNLYETVVGFLATASLGAIWSAAAPEFGARSVLDRFGQIEPKVLLAVDGYRYGDRDFDRTETVVQLREALPSVRHLVSVPHLGVAPPQGAIAWDELLSEDPGELTVEPVPFEHPLWILYSSGTTGLPKAIVHGHGGMLLEQLKYGAMHLDLRPEDRYLWFTTTGWMMWNFLVGVLLGGASIVLFDGSPGGETLWDLAEAAGVTCFGTSPAFIAACEREGVKPRGGGRALAGLRAIGSTGSPLPPEGFRWVWDELGEDVWLYSISGGTDICTAFIGGAPVLPVYEGELQASALGAKVEAWDEAGYAVVGSVGELVVTEPMPSMPVGLWGDADGSRYRETYFGHFPGVWRHGDWIEITERGTAIVTGRSDSTINRGGVRMGTSEFYRTVLALPEIDDALVVDPDGRILLFVVLAPGAELDDALRRRIVARIRTDCSPRHTPDEITAIAKVPRTLSGKVVEVPVKRILEGAVAERVLSIGSLADPDALAPFL